SKEVVKLATGLLATMAAVVLGLLITSAKDSFDRLQEDVLQSATKIILLDQVLEEYGPETKAIREMLRTNTILTVNQRFADGVKVQAKTGTTEAGVQFNSIQSRIRKLSPEGREQNSLVTRAIELSNEISLAHWALYNQDSSISSPFLVVLIFWLVIIFVSFGMFAPRNTTVMMSLFMCALAVSFAIYIILEMSSPLSGTIHINNAPLVSALQQLGH
ncbi:MAG TPA: hypothetical protein VIE69_03055, partial [Methylophilaceae bacterium]